MRGRALGFRGGRDWTGDFCSEVGVEGRSVGVAVLGRVGWAGLGGWVKEWVRGGQRRLVTAGEVWESWG